MERPPNWDSASERRRGRRSARPGCRKLVGAGVRVVLVKGPLWSCPGLAGEGEGRLVGCPVAGRGRRPTSDHNGDGFGRDSDLALGGRADDFGSGRPLLAHCDHRARAP